MGGGLDNVQSFVVFFMASLSHVLESQKSKDTRNLCTVYSGADLATVLFSHVIESQKSTNTSNLSTVIVQLSRVQPHRK